MNSSSDYAGATRLLQKFSKANVITSAFIVSYLDNEDVFYTQISISSFRLSGIALPYISRIWKKKNDVKPIKFTPLKFYEVVAKDGSVRRLSLCLYNQYLKSL